MKFRTDFVTNSSSSNYTVNITIRDTDGNEYKGTSSTYYDYATSFDHNLSCTPEMLLNVDSLQGLINLLTDSIKDEMDYSFYDDGLDDDEPCGDEQINEDYHRKYLIKAFNEFFDSLKKNISDLSQIETISLTRNWYAWGEASSCFWLEYGNICKRFARFGAESLRHRG